MDDDKVQTRIGECMKQLAIYQKKEGIFTKKYVLNNAKDMAPAVWWSTYGKHIPLIKSVAVRVLSQTVGGAKDRTLIRAWGVKDRTCPVDHV
jgi:hypothetical protein